ncbi:MAG: hypothetical protein A2Y00_07020 [Omnitrophica WOR_2 bacterium GWF2_43_52]|nr:MAG: hypothetical protein A2Y06_05145 [Omnitrophica WOR_2 bacterium GWA2_37_7]OGX20173.1 MAG: hypothetical protein A2Y00_07020 [Omnitrophica WOR_2 bacterium GWF2_43_52]OGX55744.1 MAG: hypothetical protein A2460_09145 [Omnitrophica WOR_2 bacterium RIFOXYC2_FULL_43_9]HAH19298.1 hypothetical protein [Candidatus Omnitrophota bacterium]HBG63679.1 hypothetical protein [Candidatus Omnitrophota bacterium]
MNDKIPLISIIVVNHNGKQFLEPCFGTLLNLAYPKDKVELIMVDNCSTDNSVNFVRERYPEVIVLKNDVNNYCRANNVGIEHAKGEFVAVLNNDTKVEQNWLRGLVNLMIEYHDVAAVGSKILFMDGKINSVGHRELPDFYWTDLGYKETDGGQYDTVCQASSVCAGAALFRKTAIKQIGLFDEDFEMYVEDVDVAIRLKKSGWRIMYSPFGIVHHQFHGTSNDALARFYVERNRLLLIAKHYPEKLSAAFLGRGYFTVTHDSNNLTDVYAILPLVFSKLLRHHGIETINALLPDLFDNLKKILNFEKDYLIQALDGERVKLQLKDKELTQIDIEKKEQLQDASQQLQQRLAELQLKGKDLLQKDAIIREKNDLLKQVSEQLQQKLSEADVLKRQIDAFYSSETFRYVVRPLWAMLEYIKKTRNGHKGREAEKRVLFIKPQQVSVRDTEKILEEFQEQYPCARISLIGNLLVDDYGRLSRNATINEGLLYCPDARSFSILEKVRLTLQLPRKKYAVAIVLAGQRFYLGYTLARMLALLSGAREVKQILVDRGSGAENRLESMPLKKIAIVRDMVVQSIVHLLNGFFVLGVMLLFFIFIIIDLKIRKLIYKLKIYFFAKI